MASNNKKLRECIVDIPDFPKKGIIFRDITPLLNNRIAFREAIEEIAHRYSLEDIDLIVGIEARGFIIGGALANEMNCGFVPIRKTGKLPRECYNAEYELEYGTASIEIHRDAIRPGEKVLIVDDLLATGGTAQAAENLVNKLGGVIKADVFLIELADLNGRSKLSCPVYSLLQY